MVEDTGAVTGFVEGASSGEKVKKTDKDSTLKKIPAKTMDAKKTNKDSTLKKIPAKNMDAKKTNKDSTLKKIPAKTMDAKETDKDSTLEKIPSKTMDAKETDKTMDTNKGNPTGPATPESSGSEDTQETWILGQPPPKRKTVAAKKAAAKAAAAKAKTQGGKAKKEIKSKKVKTVRKAKQSEAERKRVHRIACDRWHAKWLSKGVPRPAEEHTPACSPNAPDSSKKAKTAHEPKKTAAEEPTESQQADSLTMAKASKPNSGFPKDII